jgi:hypothetical protein
MVNSYRISYAVELPNQHQFILPLTMNAAAWRKNMASGKFKRKEAKEQKTPFKDLSFEQKVGYIWEYYKYTMLAVVIVIIAAVSIFITYQSKNYKTVCNFSIVDGKMSGFDDQTDAITTGFSNYLGIDGKKQRVVCDYNLTLQKKDGDQDAAYSQTKLYAAASTHSMDGFIANRNYITYFTTDNELFLVDLRDVLTESELDKIGSALVYYTKADGTSTPIAVDLSNTKIKTETDFTMTDPCYGVVVTAPNQDNAVAFIRYAFDL